MKRALSILLFLAAVAVFSGCATSDPENLSERPWNTPKSWEHGLPGGMMNERY